MTKARVAIVTGSGAGIGRACALRFAGAGYAVLVTDIVEEDGERTAKRIQEQGGAARFLQSDVSSVSDCMAFADAALQTWGRIDALVANAGVQTSGDLLSATEEDWERTLGVNLRGVGYSCKAVLPAMLKQHSGAIVMLSSLNAAVGNDQMPLYDASKAGVLGLMRSIAIAYGKDGVRVNAVGPGATITDYHERRAAARGITPEQLRERMKGYALVGHAAEPSEIAEAIYFLASEAASFITGQFLLVDGGASLTVGKA